MHAHKTFIDELYHLTKVANRTHNQPVDDGKQLCRMNPPFPLLLKEYSQNKHSKSTFAFYVENDGSRMARNTTKNIYKSVTQLRESKQAATCALKQYSTPFFSTSQLSSATKFRK